MNFFCNKSLNKLDEEIEYLLDKFNEIRRIVPYRTFQTIYSPYEQKLKCKISSNCSCNPLSSCITKNISLFDILDECRIVIDNNSFNENDLL